VEKIITPLLRSTHSRPYRCSLASLHHALFGHITADKNEIKDTSKLPSATSFTRKMLHSIRPQAD